MVKKASVWAPASGAALFAWTTGFPDVDELPDSGMAWKTATPGWASLTPTQYHDKAALIVGRRSAFHRAYNIRDNVVATSGTDGTPDDYGWITTEERTLANGGMGLLKSFKMMSGTEDSYASWVAIAAGNRDSDLAIAVQNVKRWRDDALNTAAKKTLLLGFHHEPTASGGSAADREAKFIAAFRYIVNYFSTANVGPGRTYDCVEWCFIDVGSAFTGGTNAFHPGDAYITWAFADPYNWGGHMCEITAKDGSVPQPGDVLGAGTRYTSAWTAQATPSRHILDWGDNHPTIRLGLAEFASAEHVDGFPVTGGVLGSTRTNAVPTAKGDWMNEARRFFRGENSSKSTNDMNYYPPDTRGVNLELLFYWQSQQLCPRWFNTKPYGPSAILPGQNLGAVSADYTLDKFITLANDPHFGVAPPPPANTGPTSPTLTVTVDPDTTTLVTAAVAATAGSSATLTHLITWGDTTSSTSSAGGALSYNATHNYQSVGAGQYTITYRVTDGNSLYAQTTSTVTIVVDPGTPPPPPTLNAPFAPLRLVTAPTSDPRDYQLPNNDVRKIRIPWNVNADGLAAMLTRWNFLDLFTGATNWVIGANIETFLDVTSRKYLVDLTGYTQIKLAVTISTAAATGTMIAPVYAIAGGSWKAFDNATANGTTLTVGNAGPIPGPASMALTASGAYESGVGSIPPEARAPGTLVSVLGYGGDGTTNPQFLRAALEVR